MFPRIADAQYNDNQIIHKLNLNISAEVISMESYSKACNLILWKTWHGTLTNYIIEGKSSAYLEVRNLMLH